MVFWTFAFVIDELWYSHLRFQTAFSRYQKSDATKSKTPIENAYVDKYQYRFLYRLLSLPKDYFITWLKAQSHDMRIMMHCVVDGYKTQSRVTFKASVSVCKRRWSV